MCVYTNSTSTQNKSDLWHFFSQISNNSLEKCPFFLKSLSFHSPFIVFGRMLKQKKKKKTNTQKIFFTFFWGNILPGWRCRRWGGKQMRGERWGRRYHKGTKAWTGSGADENEPPASDRSTNTDENKVTLRGRTASLFEFSWALILEQRCRTKKEKQTCSLTKSQLSSLLDVFQKVILQVSKYTGNKKKKKWRPITGSHCAAVWKMSKEIRQ